MRFCPTSVELPFSPARREVDFVPLQWKVLHRLTSKCISRSVCSEAHNILTPLQVGIGVPGGCEAIVHAVAQVQEVVTPPEERWTLLLDLSNTFNSIDREHMFQEVRARMKPSWAFSAGLLSSSSTSTLDQRPRMSPVLLLRIWSWTVFTVIRQ